MYENYPLRRILFQTFKDNDIHTIKASFIAKSFDNITIKMKAARPIQETKNKNDCFQLIVCSPVIQVSAIQIIDQPSKKRILKTIVTKFSRKEKTIASSRQNIYRIYYIYILYIYLCYIIYIYIKLHDRDNTKQSISFIFIVFTQQKQQKCNNEWWGKNSNDNIDDSNKTNNNNNKIRIIAITVVLVVVIIIILLVIIIIIIININNDNNNDNNNYYYNK